MNRKRTRLSGVRKSRSVGHRPKNNKKSVAARKEMKRQLARENRYKVNNGNSNG